MFIYKLTNIKNNKIYIGLTTQTIKERCRQRVSEAIHRESRTSYILNAIRKHGEKSFIVEEIDTAISFEELKKKEIFYIAWYNSMDKNIGYNLTLGGEGNKGLKMSDATKEKIRQSQLGKPWSETERKIVMEARKNANMDFSKGIENCRLHNIKTSKKVEKFDLLGNSLKIFDSISDLTKQEKLDRSGISVYLKSNKTNLNKTYKGFIYKIIE